MRFLLLAFALVGCGTATGSVVSIGPEPEPPAPEPAPVEHHSPPAIHETAPTDAGSTVLLLSPPPPGAPTAPPTDIPPQIGFHYSGSCALPDLIPKGSCQCKVEQCFNRCTTRADGTPEFHSFCFDAGLPADYRPR